jgi:hypothetical protein
MLVTLTNMMSTGDSGTTFIVSVGWYGGGYFKNLFLTVYDTAESWY